MIARFSHPMTQQRLQKFKQNRRGYWAFWMFLLLFIISLFAEFWANDKPLLIEYKENYYFPIFVSYPETVFDGFLETETDYSDIEVQELILEEGWIIWPLLPFHHRTTDRQLSVPAPSPPSWRHPLGTDDQARDVLARLVYGFRISILFGLTLTIFSSIIGVCAGLVQGYLGGKVDLYFQRFLEIWGGMPVLYLLIILAGFVQPDFWWLLGIMLLFSWTSLVGVVRAETLRARNFDFVRAAKALGVPDWQIMWRHILPNAMVASLTFMPFILNGSITTLTSLDFLGFGLPIGAPSLGELAIQAKNNLQSPWLGMTAFFTVALLLSLLVFVGEAVRDAFDPRKSLAQGGR